MKTHSALILVLVFLTASSVGAQKGQTARPSLLKATFGKLPIYFVENRGVYPDDVAYYIQGVDKTLFFTRDGITFRLKGKDRGWVVKLEFVGANPEVKPRGENKQQAVFSYFKGPKKTWKTGLRTFSKIVYHDLWPGIDLVYRGTVNQLKYEFVVKPGADPGKIRLRYRGVESLERTANGSLSVNTPAGGFEDAPPKAWQEIEGKHVPVEIAFQLDGDVFGFEIGKYNRLLPLVLDPALLVYCGYIGGASNDCELYVQSIAVDQAGNAYVTGQTYSDQGTFPVAVGPDLTWNGLHDCFVAKINPQGTRLLYCGYIGGGAWDYGQGIAVDQAGNAYVTGWTTQADKMFPLIVGPDLSHNGSYDAFVAKVNAQGTGLVYCGFIGGVNREAGHAIDVDSTGSAYVVGGTWSDEQSFPVTVGPDLTHNGFFLYDAFIAKVKPDGSGLVYCGFIGGSEADVALAVRVDNAGSAYVAGETHSSEKQNFPVKTGPDLTFNSGPLPSPDGNDGFVAKVRPDGSGLEFCGYIGGYENDCVWGLAIDTSGNAYLTGMTKSDETTFPVKTGPDLTYNGLYDAFVAKVHAGGNGLDYCGYIGGASFDYGYAVAVDLAGNAYVAGSTESDQRTFPVTAGPDLTHNGSSDAFVAKVDARGTSLVYCGYIGGGANDKCYGVAVDTTGNAYVTGMTGSDEQTFPVWVGPDLSYNGGPSDALVAKVSFTLLSGGGTPRPGGTLTLMLAASDDGGLFYQLGTSLGTGPIPIDRRRVDLSPDGLLVVTAGNSWPSVFQNYRGVIDTKGQAQAAINIPTDNRLIGVRLYTAFVTFDAQAPSGIKSISNTFSFSIAK
jgi:beta-propeller repeat-containing protein